MTDDARNEFRLWNNSVSWGGFNIAMKDLEIRGAEIY
jgi:transcription-repair coupling factor (superfamily II helicase)